MTPVGRRLAIVALAVPLSGVLAAQAPAPDDARRLLAAAFQVTPAEFARLQSGQVVSRTVSAKDRREVATLGIVRMNIAPEFFVDRLKDIVNFKRADAVLQIGVFGNPPGLSDIQGLTLEDSDLDGLRRCRVADCDVQLPADTIERLGKEVDWRQQNARQLGTEIVRQALVAYVADYQRVGSAARMQYADTSRVVDAPREFASLAEANTAIWQQVPALRRHLSEYPGLPAGAAFDILYWSKEKLGRKPVVSVTHLAIVGTAGENGADFAIASRNLYGSHYLDASMAITLLLRDRSAATPATYVAYLNRSRVDVFGGLFGGMIRRIVTSKARGAAADYLDALRRRLEAQFETRQAHPATSVVRGS
jgi:hypothetical protein